MHRSVGARPWQTYPEELFPLLLRRPDVSTLGEEDVPWKAYTFDVSVTFFPLARWYTIPKQIRRIARAIAVDMASVKLDQYLEKLELAEEAERAERPELMEEEESSFHVGLMFLHAVEDYVDMLIRSPHASFSRDQKAMAAGSVRSRWELWGGGDGEFQLPPDLGHQSRIPGRQSAIAAARGALALATPNQENEAVLDYSIAASLTALAQAPLGWGDPEADGNPNLHWRWQYPSESTALADRLNEVSALWWREVMDVVPIARGTLY